VGSSAIRQPTPPPAPPKVEDTAIQQALAEYMARRKKSQGYRSTILSSNMMSSDNQQLQTTLGS